MEGLDLKSGKSLLTSGNLIAYWRKRRQGKKGRSLSLKELAELTDISTATLRLYESGKTLPPTKNLFVIASALDIPPHILLAPQWRKTREEMAFRRKSLGMASAIPDVDK